MWKVVGSNLASSSFYVYSNKKNLSAAKYVCVYVCVIERENKDACSQVCENIIK